MKIIKPSRYFFHEWNRFQKNLSHPLFGFFKRHRTTKTSISDVGWTKDDDDDGDSDDDGDDDGGGVDFDFDVKQIS